MISNPLAFSDFMIWLLSIGVISYSLSKRFHALVAICFSFAAISSLRIFQDSLNGLPFDPMTRMFDSSAESAIISLLLTVFAASNLSLGFWEKFFKWVALTNAALIFIDSLFRIHDIPWGILLNGSMSGCLNAAIFPIFYRSERWQKALVFLSVILAGRSLPVLVLFSGILALRLLEKRFKQVFFLVPLTAFIGFFVKGHDLFHTNGRSSIWKMAFHYFQDYVPKAYGAGLGSFYVVGPYLSKDFGTVFIWLHSDWMQILFEMGFIGFALTVWMYSQAIKESTETPRLFKALISFAVFGVANMPLRYPLAGLYGAFLIRWALERTT